MASLWVISGSRAGESVGVTGELIIGRENADLTIDDAEVSRRHVAVRLEGGQLEVEDLGSANGTFVNGSRIEDPVMVGGGAKIRVGRTEFEVRGVLPTKGGKHDLTQAAASPIADPQATRATPTLDPETDEGQVPAGPAGHEGGADRGPASHQGTRDPGRANDQGPRGPRPSGHAGAERPSGPGKGRRRRRSPCSTPRRRSPRRLPRRLRDRQRTSLLRSAPSVRRLAGAAAASRRARGCRRWPRSAPRLPPRGRSSCTSPCTASPAELAPASLLRAPRGRTRAQPATAETAVRGIPFPAGWIGDRSSQLFGRTSTP